MLQTFGLRVPVKCFLFFIVSFILQNRPVSAQEIQNIGGIGASLFIDTAGGYTLPRIQGFVDNSPASKTLKVTDFIQKVNDVSCKDLTIETVVAMIRGEAGTNVKITASHDKAGKLAQDFILQRVNMQMQGGAAPPDPSIAFYSACENEAILLKKKGFQVVKTFNSECGDYFFNFDAEKQQYHIRVMTLEVKKTKPYTPGFFSSAKVFDNDNENEKAELPVLESKDLGTAMMGQLEGTITFKKKCIGVVSVKINNDVKKCGAMYVIIYK
jgi:hypothetical protein